MKNETFYKTMFFVTLGFLVLTFACLVKQHNQMQEYESIYFSQEENIKGRDKLIDEQLALIQKQAKTLKIVKGNLQQRIDGMNDTEPE